MRFSETMQSLVADGTQWRAQIGEDWLQGRSAFGGVQAALGLRAMRQRVPAAMPLRSLQATFIAPVPAGPVSLRSRMLRAGKSVMQVEGELCDGEQVLCRLLAVFGDGRPSALALMPVQPVVHGASAVKTLRYIEGQMPAFMQQFDARWLQGDLPFSGGQRRNSVIELGLRDDGRADETHVMAFADFIPPIGLSWLDKPTPGSSLTWMIELLRPRYDDLGLSGWRLDAELVAARDGYTNQSVMVWGPGGEPVALSRQSMVVFG